MITSLTITPEHFDRAVAVPWSVTTCLLAQAAKDILGREVSCGLGCISDIHNNFDSSMDIEGVEEFQDIFDHNHYEGNRFTPIPNEQLLALRARLPKTFEVRRSTE
jgi:hypothetical protein